MMTSQASADSGTIRVLSYNIRHGEGMDNRIDLVRIARVISGLHPDIALLQEIDKGARRTGHIDQMQVLAELTGMFSAFGTFMDFDEGEYGMGVLSRRPLKETVNYRLPPGSEPRSALAARIEIEGEEILCVGAHLFETLEERLAQAKQLVRILVSETVPVILAGDLNSEPHEEVIAFLRRYWEVPDKGEDRLSWPSDVPQVEIDYVMYRPAERFAVVEHRLVHEPLASDHRPLLLELQLKGLAGPNKTDVWLS